MPRSDPAPDVVQLCLLRHLAARTSLTVVTGAHSLTMLATIDDLAERLGVSGPACQAALHELVRQHRLRARLHRGGRYELRPVLTADRWELVGG
jgi:hypothetical protein